MGLVENMAKCGYLITSQLIDSCDEWHALGRRHLLSPEHLLLLLAGPISHTSTQFMDFVEILNISMDLSTIYLPHFSGC